MLALGSKNFCSNLFMDSKLRVSMAQLQRNDICHCGSGKKYKNCCLRKDEAVSQLSKQNRDVTEVVKPQMGPYLFWKQWSAACARNEFGLVYQMLEDNGSLKKTFASDEDFFVNLREIGLAYEPLWRLEKMKLNGSSAILLARRTDDSDKNADVCAAILRMQKGEFGWRVSEIEQRRVKPEKDLVLGYELFGISSVEHDYREKLKTGWTRPNLADDVVANSETSPVTTESAEAPST
jgi:hypothetical protein